jgi:hypothetical protein
VIDLKSTIAAVLALQPSTKHIYVVSGVGPFDKLYADIFRTESASFAGRVTFHELAGLPLPDLEARVRHLPQGSVLFYVSLADDGAGRTFMPLDALDSIAAASSVPVYSWHEDALGRGIVGGRLHSSISDVQETARLALRVLGGEKPETIPLSKTTATTMNSTGDSFSAGRSTKRSCRREASSAFASNRSSSRIAPTSWADHSSLPRNSR